MATCSVGQSWHLDMEILLQVTCKGQKSSSPSFHLSHYTSPHASWSCQSPSRCEMVMLSVSGEIFCFWKPLSELPLCSTSSSLGAPCQCIKIALAWWLHEFSQTGQLAELSCSLLLRGRHFFFLSPPSPNMNSYSFILTREEVSFLRLDSAQT